MISKKNEDIGLLADTVRDCLDLSTPIDVQSTVTRLGGKLEEKAKLSEGMEAKITRKDEKFHIIIQSSLPNNRKRFTIAHELGHLFLHMGFLIDPVKWDITSEYRDSVFYRYGHSIEEKEANEFAAAFLMPKNEFVRITAKLNREGYSADRVAEKVAQHFQTSKEATINRGRALGVFKLTYDAEIQG